jgi:membrane protein DedA with SNARE-associated domain
MKALLNTLIAWGPLGVFVVAVIDGAGVPSPGGLDWMLILLCVNRPDLAYGMAGLAVVGSLIGGLFLYWIARRGGDAMLKKYRERPRFARFERWFQRYGLLTVFIPALVPIPMPLKFFVICAGVFEVPVVTYLLVMLVARVPRYLGLAYLGSQLGRESFAWLRSHAWHMIGVALLLFLFLYLLILIADNRRRLTARE